MTKKQQEAIAEALKSLGEAVQKEDKNDIMFWIGSAIQNLSNILND